MVNPEYRYNRPIASQQLDDEAMPQPATRLSDALYISNAIDAKDKKLILSLGIRSILSLDGTVTKDNAGELGVNRIESFRLIDGAGNDPHHLKVVILTLKQLSENFQPTLIQCHAGKSRSVCIAAALQSLKEKKTFQECLDEIARIRNINPNRNLIYDVETALNLIKAMG